MNTNARNKKILLVDDCASILLSEQLMLRREYLLLVAHDGAEGLKVALRERPDLILLDVVMPKMGGLDVCKLLRAIDGFRSTPIILVSTELSGGSLCTRQRANASTSVRRKPTG